MNIGAYCLALDQRKDFIPQIQVDVKQFLNLDLKPFWVGDGTDQSIQYEMIDSTDTQLLWNCLERPAQHSFRGHANAFLSHRHILCDALAYDQILLCEDDIQFLPKRWDIMGHYIQGYVERGDYDAFYLGWQAKQTKEDSDDLNEHEKYWKVNKDHYFIKRAVSWCPAYNTISGWHCLFLKKSLIKTLLGEVKQGPYDGWLARNLNRLNVMYMCPKVVAAKSCFSYCEQKWQERSVLE